MREPLRYLSVCSGIEAASVAWEPLGWQPVAFCEIDRFPSKVLAHRWPNVPNLGDFANIALDKISSVDILIGGTPCQAFSVAGKRLSLSDARGNLTLAYVVLAHELAQSHGLRTAVWENVPGVLNTPDNAFGCFLGALIGHDGAIPAPRGNRWTDAGMADGPRGRAAWIVRDAQYFGLAQRRARVFLVADLGNGPDPAAVLFERKGLRRNPPSRGEARKDLAPTLSARTQGGGGLGTDFDCDNGLIAHTLRAEGFDASEDGTGRVTPIVPVAFNARQDPIIYGDMSGPIDTDGSTIGIVSPPSAPIAFSCKDYGNDAAPDLAPTMRAMGGVLPNGGGQLAVPTQWAVRRLTPRECERLQGFPDDWTNIPGAKDGPRYKALGNSMAVPVMRWIGERIYRAILAAHAQDAAE